MSLSYTNAKVFEQLDRVRELASCLPDPEIPVITIAELGILREVVWNEHRQTIDVVLTPTYNGCPAMDQIEHDLDRMLREYGIDTHRIVRVLSPAWTTDWMTPAAREKLRAYGIAPPCTDAQGNEVVNQENVVVLMPKRVEKTVPCPRCGSSNTTETSHFGSTACKALYKCLACEEPFDYFKPH